MNKATLLLALTLSAGLTSAASAQAYRAVPLPPGEHPVVILGGDSGEELEWTTIDGGGGRLSSGAFVIEGTVGQFDTQVMSGGPLHDLFELESGFWAPIEAPPCYANCDQSTAEPSLNVADFSCFLSKFAAGDPYANCDHSTNPPTLNVADFSCFLTKFAAGCT